MKDLGNKAVETRSGPAVQIARPEAAEDLLELGLSAAERRQRVIFFCACENPAHCHRANVAELVSHAARRRGTPIEIVEWPGGDPISLELEISQDVFAKIDRGGKTIALPRSADRAQLAGLPWYSSVMLRSGSETLDTLCSPAFYSTKLGWHLKILARCRGEVAQSLKYKRIHEFRQQGGYEAVA